jgi:GcrA cell cycle regulator
MKTLRATIWDLLPLTAPGLLKSDLVDRIIADGRQTNVKRIEGGLSELREQNALRRSAGRPVRYWRGSSEPELEAPPAAGSWPGADLEILRCLWAEGLSTPEIGRRMGRSKSSVIGKAHRLDLPSRPSPINRSAPPGGDWRRVPRASGPTLPPLRSERLPAAVAVVRAAAVERAVRPKIPMLLLPRSPVPLPPSLPVRREKIGGSERYTCERPSDKCQWMLNDNPPWLVCSGWRAPGSAYCDAHRAMSVVRSHAPRPPDEASPPMPHVSIRFGARDV